jgi:hypothetical protein
MIEERDVQKQYWLEHSSEPTVEAMMLDSNAAEIDKSERPEVRTPPPPPPRLLLEPARNMHPVGQQLCFW